MVSRGNIIFFCAGSFIGAVGAIFLSKRHFQKISEEKIENFVAEFNQKMGNFDKNEAEGVSDEVESDGKIRSYGEVYEGTKSDVNYEKFYSENDDEKIDPAELVGPSEEDEDDDDYYDDYYDEWKENQELSYEEFINENELEKCNKDMMDLNKKPKLITAESYDEEYRYFDKIPLDFYSIDGILVDPTSNEEIMDPERIVGDCLDKFSFRDNDEQVIFVRNFSHGADYEISKVFSPFYDDY